MSELMIRLSLNLFIEVFIKNIFSFGTHKKNNFDGGFG